VRGVRAARAPHAHLRARRHRWTGPHPPPRRPAPPQGCAKDGAEAARLKADGNRAFAAGRPAEAAALYSAALRLQPCGSGAGGAAAVADAVATAALHCNRAQALLKAAQQQQGQQQQRIGAADHSQEAQAAAEQRRRRAAAAAAGAEADATEALALLSSAGRGGDPLAIKVRAGV
jgi:hypothetical protein